MEKLYRKLEERDLYNSSGNWNLLKSVVLSVASIGTGYFAFNQFYEEGHSLVSYLFLTSCAGFTALTISHFKDFIKYRKITKDLNQNLSDKLGGK